MVPKDEDEDSTEPLQLLMSEFGFSAMTFDACRLYYQASMGYNRRILG